MYNIDKPVKSHQKESTPNIQVAALAELLQDDEIELICRQLGHTWRNRIFTPAVILEQFKFLCSCVRYVFHESIFDRFKKTCFSCL